MKNKKGTAAAIRKAWEEYHYWRGCTITELRWYKQSLRLAASWRKKLRELNVWKNEE